MMSTAGNQPEADDDSSLTVDEKALLAMYSHVKQYERIANRLREETARAKLAAKDAAFQQKKKKKRRKRLVESDKNEPEDDDEGDEEEDEYEDEPVSLQERREAKLEELREEVEEAEAKMAQSTQQQEQEEALRAQLLAEQDFDDNEQNITLKRKRRMDEEPASSLIANITAAATPPHDFSKSLHLTAGKVLFPTDPQQTKWNPPEGVFSPNDGAFVSDLENFDINQAQTGRGGNTLAVKFMAPPDSKRFSLNICAPDNDSFQNVLFHFNPRQHERGGQLVVNNKIDGVWGQTLAIPLSQVPLLFGQTSCTLMVQVNGEGFDIFLEQQHVARLEHRQDLEDVDHLVVQFPSTDDYGSPEDWTVYKVWWGNRPILAKGDVSDIAGVNQYNSLHPRKLFISQLPKIYSDSDVDHRRAELERAFVKYSGDRGIVQVIVPTNATYAFVEVESERMADLALQEMAGQYRLNRARRSRHEALQEERAAKQGAPVKESSSGWD